MGRKSCLAQGNLHVLSIVANVILAVILVTSFVLPLLAPTSGAATVSTGGGRRSIEAPQVEEGCTAELTQPLVVMAGETCWINGTGTSSTFYVHGNVTVEFGATLVIQNVTVSIVQSVPDSGTSLSGRLSELSKLYDSGSVNFVRSILTTDTNASNPYIKFNVTVTGTLSLFDSSFEFPGWVNLVGSSAEFLLNQSTVTSNPLAGKMTLPEPIIQDASYAPDILARSGARVIAFASSFDHVYADNFSANGVPAVLPITDPSTFTISPSDSVNLSTFVAPDSATELIQDFLNPVNLTASYLEFNYTLTGSLTTNITFGFNGENFDLGFFPLSSGTNSIAILNLPPLLQAAIRQVGTRGLLSSTASFGSPTSSLTVGFLQTGVGTSSATITNPRFLFGTDVSYNLTFEGTGTTLVSADSSFAVNWNSTSQVDSRGVPWQSSKLNLQSGALALLANLSVPSRPPSGSASVIVVGSLSQAITYRWAEFSAAGPGGFIGNATVSAFPASTETNASTNQANNLEQSNPGLASYVSWVSAQLGFGSYGKTSASGIHHGEALLLLAADQMAPGGSPVFLGNYTVLVNPTTVGIAAEALTCNVTPYPEDLDQPSLDVIPLTYFPDYSSELSIVADTYLIEGVMSANASIGDTVVSHVEVTNFGPAASWNLSASLELADPNIGLLSEVASTGILAVSLQSLESYTLVESWTITQTTVGLHGAERVSLGQTVEWDGGSAFKNGGSAFTSTSFVIEPSKIAISNIAGPPSALYPSRNYTVNGTVTFNGTGSALIRLSAVPSFTNATVVALGSTFATDGPFSLVFGHVGSELTPGTSYDLTLQATFNNGSSSEYILPGTFSEAPSSLNISSMRFLISGLEVESARIGQTLELSALLTNQGAAAVSNISGSVELSDSATNLSRVVSMIPFTVVDIFADATLLLETNWTVNQTVVGLHGLEKVNLTFTVEWNGGSGFANGGAVSLATPFTILPSTISVVKVTSPPATLYPNRNYTISGTVAFNGTGNVEVSLLAQAQETDGVSVLLAEAASDNSTFLLFLVAPGSLLVAGVSYNLVAEATFNTVTSSKFVLNGSFSEPVASLVAASIECIADGSSTDSVRIGQTIGIEATFSNSGVAYVQNVTETILVVDASLDLTSEVLSITYLGVSIPNDGNLTVFANWTVTQDEIGLHGFFNATVEIEVGWNGGVGQLNGGSVTESQPLEIQPSNILVENATAPPSILSRTQNYTTIGSISFNGTGSATIMLFAIPAGSGSPIEVTTARTSNRSFVLTYGSLGSLLSQGVRYDLVVKASFNNATSPPYAIPGTVSLAPLPPPNASIPWGIVAIVASVLVGVTSAIFVTRRARSRAVECGECGSILPKAAKTCPICGTLFDYGDVRCSQCGDDIPTNAAECPTCHRTLANRPGRPGSLSDRESYHEHIEQFRAAAHGDLGDDFPEPSFWEWWRQQPAYQSYRDWLEGRPPRPPGADAMDKDPLGLGDGR